MARRKRQLRLLEENPPETRSLFTEAEFPYDTPDEIAYNSQRKADGLFDLNPEEEGAKDNGNQSNTTQARKC